MTIPACCVGPREPPLSSVDADRLARMLKALADPARLRIVSMVTASDEACVCDFQDVLGLSQPTVSHHCKVLTEAGILEREQRGRWAYYRLASETLAGIAAALSPPAARSVA